MSRPTHVHVDVGVSSERKKKRGELMLKTGKKRRQEERTLLGAPLLLGARTLLGAPGLTTRSKNATRGSWPSS